MAVRVEVTPFTVASSNTLKGNVLRGSASPHEINAAIAIYRYQITPGNATHVVAAP